MFIAAAYIAVILIWSNHPAGDPVEQPGRGFQLRGDGAQGDRSGTGLAPQIGLAERQVLK